jgi:hypothetical protein
MNKLLFSMLFLPLYLFSAELNISKSYDEGLKYYKTNNFKKSYAVFYDIYLQKLDDTTFNFYFGRSAYETGHYAMALAAFERVEIQDGSNLRNRLEMARTYYMLKMYEDAEIAFKDVLANPNIPDNIRKNIELSLSRVSKVQEKSFTYITTFMNVLYDSNVNFGSLGDYQYGGSTLSKINTHDDGAVEAFASVNNIYDIGDKNGFALKNGISIFAKEYFTEDDYNTLYLSYMPSLLYKETKFTSELALGVDLLTLGRENYLNTFSIAPSLQYNHTISFRSLFYMKYQYKRFMQDYQKGLNANHYELAYGVQDILTPRSFIQSNFYFINESKDTNKDSSIYVDFNEYKLNLSYANQFTSRYSIDLYGQIRARDYKEYSEGFDSKREDIGGLVNANFTFIIIPTLTANLKTSYEYVNSNQDRFSYEKYIISAGISKTF